jgi:hypothetical protein
VALSRELGVHNRPPYKWRDQLDPIGESDGSLHNARKLRPQKEVRQLKRVPADKVMEVDFFRGALQKVEARGQRGEVWREGVYDQIWEMMPMQGSLMGDNRNSPSTTVRIPHRSKDA